MDLGWFPADAHASWWVVSLNLKIGPFIYCIRVQGAPNSLEAVSK